MVTNSKEFMNDYMTKRRSTKEGSQENVNTVEKSRSRSPEAREAYNTRQREYMRKKAALKKAQENPLD